MSKNQSLCISSPEQNYFAEFAMRYPVGVHPTRLPSTVTLIFLCYTMLYKCDHANQKELHKGTTLLASFFRWQRDSLDDATKVEPICSKAIADPPQGFSFVLKILNRKRNSQTA